MNHIVFPVIVMIALLSLAGFAGSGGIRKSNRQPGLSISARKLTSMSRDEVFRLLSRVEKLEEPELMMGAMCYEPVAIPYVLEYVCPECGEKTVYECDGSMTSQVLMDIATTRMLFQELDSLTQLDMTLDESSFCTFCRDDSVTEPALTLRVTWDDGSEHASSVFQEDLRMLIGLLSGRLDYSTSNDGTFPLKPQVERLRELLGV